MPSIIKAPIAHAGGGGAALERPIRIGIMLRAVYEVDGAGVYIRALCEAMLKADRKNQYILFYRTKDQAGLFSGYPNVKEVVLPAPHKLIWDQVSVPVAAARERLDVLFHHKFSIPVAAACSTVVQQRGAEYWTMPETRDRFDNIYNRLMIPVYCKRATRVLTNSHSLADELHRFVRIPRERMQTVYAAADQRFTPVSDPDTLERVRQSYGLPRSGYFLMVAKGYHRLGYTGAKLYDRKNIRGALTAHAQTRRSVPGCPSLVIAGPGITERLRAESDADVQFDMEAIVAPGPIRHEDMPAVYSMATALVFPSYSESFGIPLVEAMACGCPVITSNAGACPEVVADAALIVAPDDIAGLADAMRRLVEDAELGERLRSRGLARAKDFSWEASAAALLTVLEDAARQKK